MLVFVSAGFMNTCFARVYGCVRQLIFGICADLLWPGKPLDKKYYLPFAGSGVGKCHLTAIRQINIKKQAVEIA